ncbi:MAG: hypothetical protein IPG72_12200 [Ardenticatenales bacterium]|nr:hypothetical protein [Ardenticatenales bacterium]
MPDIEDRIWTKFKDQGVVVAAIDPNGDSADGVQAWSSSSGVTYPIGLESPDTPTYKALVKNFKGLNPYPVDVVVGRDGTIAYISREYDPDGLLAAVEAELAKEAPTALAR